MRSEAQTRRPTPGAPRSAGRDRQNAAVRAWVNGRLLADATQPAIAVSDHGVTVGDGVFEAIKVVDGQPFALQLHLDRLVRSADGLGLAEPDQSAVRRGIGEVLDSSSWPMARLRITYTAGPAPLGSGRGHAEPTLIVVADELAPPRPTSRW